MMASSHATCIALRRRSHRAGSGRTAFSAPPPPPSGEVSVADQGQTTALPDGVVVAFEPNTTARWAGASKLSGEAAKWVQGFHIDLTDGEVEVTMPQGAKGAHAFLVSTRAGTLTVWRGRMHVTVRGDTTAVAVYEGALLVGSNRQTFPVSNPGALVLHRTGEAEKSRVLRPAPSWDGAAGPPSFAVVPEGSPATLGIAWAPASGAESYRVQIGTDAEMTRIVQQAAVGDARFSLPAPSPGIHYFAQVRSVGQDGIVGAWSGARALRVAHYRLPPGAFVARDGAVVLPFGTSLALTDGEGLDLAFETVRPGPPPPSPAVLYWTKLGGPLRLLEDAPVRIAHLRDATLGVEARVMIAQRQLRADVELAPRQAKPRDPIDVRAVVSDPSGHVDVSNEAVSLEA